MKIVNLSTIKQFFQTLIVETEEYAKDLQLEEERNYCKDLIDGKLPHWDWEEQGRLNIVFKGFANEAYEYLGYSHFQTYFLLKAVLDLDIKGGKYGEYIYTFDALKEIVAEGGIANWDFLSDLVNEVLEDKKLLLNNNSDLKDIGITIFKINKRHNGRDINLHDGENIIFHVRLGGIYLKNFLEILLKTLTIKIINAKPQAKIVPNEYSFVEF